MVRLPRPMRRPWPCLCPCPAPAFSLGVALVCNYSSTAAVLTFALGYELEHGSWGVVPLRWIKEQGYVEGHAGQGGLAWSWKYLSAGTTS